MSDDHYRRADDGSVLSVAMAALMLIVVGLGLMVWDENRNAGAVTVSVLQQR